jgi:hypothetical protein
VAAALKLVHFGRLQHCRTYYQKAANVTELPSGKNLARVALEDYEHPEMPVDNNYLENQIRPFLTGRRAWLFAHNQHGAKASTNLYSLVSCARVTGLEPHAYLRYLLEELPKATTAAALEALLPWNVKTLLQARATAA